MHTTVAPLHKRESFFVLIFGLLFFSPYLLTAQNVLFVVGDTLLDPGDQIIALSLQNQSGLSLEIKDDDGIQSSAANGKDLVLISSTTSAGKIGTTFTNTPTIVSCYNRELYDELGMVAPGGTGTVYESSIHLSDPATPWWLKLFPVQVTNSTHPFTYATINGNATMHSHVPGNTSQALSFTYPSGSQMYGMTAPADRVGLFLQDAYASLIDLTTLGQTLLQASFGLTNPIQVNETKTFMGRYGVTGDAEYKILKKPSGGYMLIGSGQTPAFDWNFHIIELDDEGLQTAAHSLHTPDLQEDSESRFNMKTAAVATNGDIINAIEGRYWDGSAWAGCISPIIVRMDENRNVQYIKRLQLGCNYPQALRATSDNGFQLLSVGQTQTWLHKFDAAGNVVWDKFMSMGTFLFRDMQVLSDGSAIMLGANPYEADPNLKFTKVLMVKVDNQGTVLWSKEHDLNGNKLETYGLDILANGNIAVTGQFDIQGNGKAAVLLFDPSGNYLSGKHLDLGGISMAYSLITHPDGGFVIGGGTRSHNFDGREEPFIARFSETGVMQWMEVYHQDIAPVDAKAMQFSMTADWGYIISAATGNTGFPGLIIKTDALGKLRGSYQCRSEEITNAQISTQAISITTTNANRQTIDHTFTLTAYTHTENTKPCVPEFPSACPIELPECPTVSLEFMTPDDTKNFIASYTPRVALALPLGADAKTELQKLDYAHELVQAVTYVDGLGRPEQQIAPQSAADGADIISFSIYDGFGRMPKEYMPYESLGTYGDYQNSPQTDQQSFYTAKFPTYGTTRLFTEHQYEASQRSREVETAAPGVPWETKSSTTFGQRETGEHTVITSYDLNQAGEVYFIPLDVTAGTNLSATYAPGELSKTTTTDENDGISETFTDKMGKNILTRVQIEGSEYAETYYCYDKYGNILYVIPPEATKAIFETGNDVLSQTILDSWCFQYEYDERNRVARKKVPGAGWVELIYNKLDQLVLTQDANQTLDNEWLYTKYDAFARPVETGIYTSSNAKSVLEGQINGASLFEVRQSGNDGYSNTAFPTTNTEKLSITYYDDYDFDRDGSPDHLYQATGTNEKSRGFITGVNTKVLDSSPEKWLLTLTFYDDYGREIETRSEHLHGNDITKYQLNFIGEIEKNVTEHNGPNSTAIIQTREYCYDHNGRMLRLTSQVNSDAPIVLSSYEYDVLGRQATKKLHSKDGLAYLQNVDYSYNIRGWMTAINEVPTADDLFEFSLAYNDNSIDIGGAGTDMFNGNIAGMSWKTALDNEKHSYSFSYDKVNRLKTANYGVGGSYTINQGRYDVSLDYDRNGNISKLLREGKDSNSSFGTMDSLSYFYKSDNGNRLARVKDNAGSTAGVEQFFDGNTSGDDYIYDANGNVTEDKNKGISIAYNHLNKPTLITKGSNTISYIYDAAGTKLQQIINDGSTKTNDYINGVHYENNNVQFFAHEEGRLVPDGTIAEYRYEFTLNDHLGNARLTFSDLDDDGTIQTSSEVLQTDHYYPFGMRMSLDAGIASTANPPNDYLYNGKELQNNLDINWYDYGARMYDASIARWNGVDRKSGEFKSFSPYNYAVNNPIFFIDPDGNKIRPGGQNADAATQEAALEVIRNTLPAEDAAFVVLDENGFIDNAKIQERAQETDDFNFSRLADISDDAMIIEFNLGTEMNLTLLGDVDHTISFGAEVRVMGEEEANAVRALSSEGSVPSTNETSSNGIVGQTIIPKSGEIDTQSGNAEVLVHSGLSDKGKAEVAAHELYAHIYLAVQGQEHRHDKQVVKDTVIDGYKYGIERENNLLLKGMLELVMSEAAKNYDSRQK